MKYTMHISNNQDTIYIPQSKQEYDIIQISCADDITNIHTIENVMHYIKKLHPKTQIHINCKMMKHLESILPKIQCLKIRINTSNDFEKFLEMDNHLNVQDTNNKDLNLIVQPDVKIDGCKPSDLPIIWNITQL